MDSTESARDAAARRLASILSVAAGEPVEVLELRALSGGAASLTYDVSAERGGKPWRLVLQHGIAGAERPISRPIQAALQERMLKSGVKVPRIVAVLTPQDGLGDGFVMEFIDGETLAPRWLRAPEMADARRRMVEDTAAALAAIHAVDVESLADLHLPVLPARRQLEDLRALYEGFDEASPTFEFAFAALTERLPQEERTTLVHGDFRAGNFIVGADGLRAVLDWELAHIGNPLIDIGWLCTNAWRFGHADSPVGGFGEREDFYAAYESAGGVPVDREAALTFEMFGSLRWGVMCMQMAAGHLSGAAASVERAAIGRRVSETEADLIYMLKYGVL